MQKFHREENASTSAVDFVNGADVGMIESSGGFRLALEAAYSGGIGMELFRKELSATRRWSLESSAS
jgi:hypothetical protein